MTTMEDIQNWAVVCNKESRKKYPDLQVVPPNQRQEASQQLKIRNMTYVKRNIDRINKRIWRARLEILIMDMPKQSIFTRLRNINLYRRIYNGWLYVSKTPITVEVVNEL